MLSLTSTSEKISFSLLFIFIPLLAFSQSKIDKALDRYNSNSVDYIHVEELAQKKKSNQNLKLLDAREASEYSISHLQDAIYAGYDDFNLKSIQDKIQKKDTIVVYCSIGVRSERIGERLQTAGYTNVYNLYGGIFDWFNKGNKIYDQKGNSTQKIHSYSRFWSNYLQKGEKVY